MPWQGSQVRALKRQTRGNGITLPGHNALLIRETVLSEGCVDGFQVTAFWERHEVVAACIPHQIFDTSFLPTGMHIGKERLKAIDTLEVQKHLMLSSAMSLQHLQDSRLEIVVNGHTCYSPPELKGMALTEQKRFLSLSGEAFDKHRPPKAQPSGQEGDFYQLAFDTDGRSRLPPPQGAWPRCYVRAQNGWLLHVGFCPGSRPRSECRLEVPRDTPFLPSARSKFLSSRADLWGQWLTFGSASGSLL